VIATIRRSRTTQSAHTNLRRRFKLSQAQAQAILDMPLKRLAALERRKIQDEYKEKWPPWSDARSRTNTRRKRG
jgi:DNA gyrase subunit A